jgi:hypothetical protein
MFSRKNLDIHGYQGESVPNTFLQQNEATEHAAIVFPGPGYTCQGPVLHYPTFELVAQGRMCFRSNIIHAAPRPTRKK